ncbi:hypothetical protein [Martelella sp. HB161492]|uniref:hypothetical protein n=1 Tax=Martelella sp. HB161492 TaxID=2720726 RepID=UPI001590D032|nr:hypothetical protein [Martelella sp. HB161492]
MGEITVPLSKSYPAGDKTFAKVVLREPTYADIYMSGLGEPVEWQPAKGGGVVQLVYWETIDQYLQRLIVEPGYEHIAKLSAQDSKKLKRGVIGFFSDVPTSTGSETSSPSGSDGTQAASSE